jgi:hypothetical protein
MMGSCIPAGADFWQLTLCMREGSGTITCGRFAHAICLVCLRSGSGQAIVVAAIVAGSLSPDLACLMSGTLLHCCGCAVRLRFQNLHRATS